MVDRRWLEGFSDASREPLSTGPEAGRVPPKRIDHVGDVAHDRKQILLAPRFKHVFQLEADVKMIFDGALAAAGDDNDVLNSGMQRLLDAILNERFIDQG